MAYKLLVVTPFNDYQRGDEITDQKIVKQILNPRNALHAFDSNTRRVWVADEPKPDESKLAEPDSETQTEGAQA